MKHFLFFGNTPELSRLEAQALLKDQDLTMLAPDIAATDSEIDPVDFLAQLGGSFKIASFAKRTDVKSLKNDIVELILASAERKFVVSDYAKSEVPSDLVPDIKDSIGDQKKVRFPSFALDSHSLVAIKKRHITEINILEDDQGIFLSLTSAVHDFEGWAARDRFKPYRNVKRGMMPPKLARMMVNIAARGENGLTIADPFCGTGTIILEALMREHNVIASDLMPDAIAGTQKNILWLLEKHTEINTQHEVIVSDATQLHRHINHVDCIVTEPFMGELIEEKGGRLFQKGRPVTINSVKNILKGLDKLYLGSLKSWRNILSGEGRVVMIFPEFNLDGITLLPEVIDTCEKIGYNVEELATYSKPDATIRRKIVLLSKK